MKRAGDGGQRCVCLRQRDAGLQPCTHGPPPGVNSIVDMVPRRIDDGIGGKGGIELRIAGGGLLPLNRLGVAPTAVNGTLAMVGLTQPHRERDQTTDSQNGSAITTASPAGFLPAIILRGEIASKQWRRLHRGGETPHSPASPGMFSLADPRRTCSMCGVVGKDVREDIVATLEAAEE